MVNAEEQEVWKTYPDYPFIEASNLGRIRTKDRYVPNGKGKRLVKGRVLKQRLNNSGYMQVFFRTKGKRISLLVHRIIAICFIPNSNGYSEVNHIDCDPTNNRLDNLEWCNHQENIEYRDKLGRWVNNNPGHPVIAVDLNSLKVFWFESQHEAARQLDVNVGNMNSVIKGRQNKTGGHWFCYADENTVEKVRAKFGNEVAEKVEELMKECSN